VRLCHDVCYLTLLRIERRWVDGARAVWSETVARLDRIHGEGVIQQKGSDDARSRFSFDRFFRPSCDAGLPAERVCAKVESVGLGLEYGTGRCTVVVVRSGLHNHYSCLHMVYVIGRIRPYVM